MTTPSLDLKENPGSKKNLPCDQHSHDSDPSPMVCYCYHKTKQDILDDVQKFGSLKEFQEKTGVGLGCGGCRIFLTALTNEETVDITQQKQRYDPTTACVAPGSRIMSGFLIKHKDLYSKVYATNAVAPQFKDCNMTGLFDYMVLDSRGNPLIHKNIELKTNEMFSFDIRETDLPDNFCGMFLFGLPRQNYGATRFNIQWSNGQSTTSTHENFSTGRPRVFLPVIYTREMLQGWNDVYIGQINPHSKEIHFTIAVFDINTNEKMVWSATIPPYGSSWICASDAFLRPALERFQGNSVGFRIENIGADATSAVTNYYFFHNRKTNTWSSQHL